MNGCTVEPVRCTILGCATSIGVPVLGCPCAVCKSPDPRDVRTRVSILVEWHGFNILVDTAPDLRQQLLREGRVDIDHVLYTHTHADHIFGLDDLRPVHFLHREEIQVWGRSDHLETLKTIFPYAFSPATGLGPIPRLIARAIEPGTTFFPEEGVPVVAIPVEHGPEQIVGYRFGRLAYLTDVSAIPPSSEKLLEGVDTLIIGALRDRPHPKHFSVEQAVQAGKRLAVRKLILTHLGHELGYADLNDRLPSFAEPAYDGLVVTIA